MALTLVRVRPHGWRGPKNLCVTIPDQIGSSTFLGDTKGSGLYFRRWASTHFNLHRRWRTKDPGQSVLNLCFSRGFVSLCFLSVDSSSLAIQSNPIRLLACPYSSCRWSCCGGDICQQESCQQRLFRNKRVKGKGLRASSYHLSICCPNVRLDLLLLLHSSLQANHRGDATLIESQTSRVNEDKTLLPAQSYNINSLQHLLQHTPPVHHPPLSILQSLSKEAQLDTYNTLPLPYYIPTLHDVDPASIAV